MSFDATTGALTAQPMVSDETTARTPLAVSTVVHTPRQPNQEQAPSRPLRIELSTGPRLTRVFA